MILDLLYRHNLMIHIILMFFTVGFRYTSSCPPSLANQMRQCHRQNMKTWLEFHSENELVALGTHRNIKDACRYINNFYCNRINNVNNDITEKRFSNI